MPIKKMKEYVELCSKGDESLKERLKMIEEQEENINFQIKELEYYKKEIEFKKAYYQAAIAAGSEEAVKDWSCKEATLEVDKLL